MFFIDKNCFFTLFDYAQGADAQNRKNSGYAAVFPSQHPAIARHSWQAKRQSRAAS